MRAVRAALQYAKPLKMKRREGDQPGQSLCSRKAAHQKQRWIATHAGPLLPERARNADHIFRSRAVLVQGRSRTSMATTPSRGDTSQLGRIIERPHIWTAPGCSWRTERASLEIKGHVRAVGLLCSP